MIAAVDFEKMCESYKLMNEKLMMEVKRLRKENEELKQQGRRLSVVNVEEEELCVYEESDDEEEKLCVYEESDDEDNNELVEFIPNVGRSSMNLKADKFGYDRPADLNKYVFSQLFKCCAYSRDIDAGTITPERVEVKQLLSDWKAKGLKRQMAKDLILKFINEHGDKLYKYSFDNTKQPGTYTRCENSVSYTYDNFTSYDTTFTVEDYNKLTEKEKMMCFFRFAMNTGERF